MQNTLGLDDDLDGVELMRRLERLFDVTVSDDEAAKLTKVGGIYDLLLEKIPPNDNDGRCTSAMAFFRVRRALLATGRRDKLTPSSNMGFLQRGRTKKNLKVLEQETGLRMPETQLTRIGRVAAIVGFVLALAGMLFLHLSLGSALLGILAGAAAIAIVYKLDPGRLPERCSTFGGFARVVAFENFGRLAKLGGRHTSEDIWQILLEALSPYALPKSEITRETVFLQSQLKSGGSR